MTKRIIASLIVFAILAVSALALTMPRNTNYEYVIDDPTDEIVAVLTIDDVDGMNNCSIEDANTIAYAGGDFPHVIFADVHETFSSAVVNVEDHKDGISILFNAEDSEGFTENNSTTEIIPAGDNDSVYPSMVDSSVNIRLGSYDDFNLVSLELHTAVPKLVPVETRISPLLYVGCIAFALVCAAAVFILDKKFGFLDKIFDFLKTNKKQLIAFAAGLVSSAALATLAEFIIYRVRLSLSDGAFYNPYEAAFIWGVLFIITVIIIFAKQLGEKPEKAFLLISLSVCTLFIIICPFGHVSWDENTHYRWALNASYLGPTSYITEADRRVMVVTPEMILDGVTDYDEKEQLDENQDGYYEDSIAYTRDDYTTVAHSPYGYFLALARFLGLSFTWIWRIAKFGSAFVYCFVCYFAMRRLKSGKMILAVVAMLPTALFLASHFSYDYWTNCFSILGMAYFVGNLQDGDEPISIKDTLIMCAAFGLAALPKLVYALLLVIPFFMKPRKIRNKKAYYSICVFAIIALVTMLGIMTFSQMKSGGDIRGGYDVSTTGQLKYILANPFVFAKMMLRYLSAYLSVQESFGYITHFAYVGKGLGQQYFVLPFMLIVAFTDKNKHDLKAYGWLVKLLAIAVYVGMAGVIATALYITFTPVGYGQVLGCQERYLIPLLYPLLSVIGWGGFKNKMPRGIYNTAILIVMAAVSLYNIYTFFLPYVS